MIKKTLQSNAAFFIQICKPGSVHWFFNQLFYHLSSCAIADTIYQPTLLTIILQWTKASSLVCEVYLVFQHLRFTLLKYHYFNPWALTSRFHLFPLKTDSYFLWHLLFPSLQWDLSVRKQVALCCPDFPLVSDKSNTSDRTICNAKVNNVIEKTVNNWLVKLLACVKIQEDVSYFFILATL